MSDLNKTVLQYAGTIKSIGPVQQVTESFKKQAFVVKDESSQYPQDVEFEFHKDSVNKLLNFKVGSVVNVSFNLRGRQWTDPKNGAVKTFNTLQAWNIAALGVQPAAATEAAPGPAAEPSDDLPF